MTTVETKWYRFHQNNSFGVDEINEDLGIGKTVYVEAIDTGHANSRAESIGLYFDGVDADIDCSCCGDRWYRVWDNYDASSTLDWDSYWNPSYAHPIEGPFYLVERGEE